jgi:protein-S-isoprenylcysteine O-methyltransferase Ste14
MTVAKNQKKHKNSLWMEVFDVMFIMLLCFVILLTTMLMRGKVLVGSGSTGGINYSFNLPIFLLIVVALGTYLFYVISRSDKELKAMIKYSYDEVEKVS